MWSCRVAISSLQYNLYVRSCMSWWPEWIVDNVASSRHVTSMLFETNNQRIKGAGSEVEFIPDSVGHEFVPEDVRTVDNDLP